MRKDEIVSEPTKTGNVTVEPLPIEPLPIEPLPIEPLLIFDCRLPIVRNCSTVARVSEAQGQIDGKLALVEQSAIGNQKIGNGSIGNGSIGNHFILDAPESLRAYFSLQIPALARRW